MSDLTNEVKKRIAIIITILALAVVSAGAGDVSYWIRVWGNADGFHVEYSHMEDKDGDGDIDFETEWLREFFEVESLDEIRPTPAELATEKYYREAD